MTDAGKKKPKPKNHEEIIGGFQQLRQEQRFLTQKIAEMELEHHEHKIVIDTLKDLEGSRKCFRMIGGVLCERTVEAVLPVLRNNEEKLSGLVQTLNQQLINKGKELNAYKEEHNIRVKVGDDDPISNDQKQNEQSAAGAGSGVLVS